MHSAAGGAPQGQGPFPSLEETKRSIRRFQRAVSNLKLAVAEMFVLSGFIAAGTLIE